MVIDTCSSSTGDVEKRVRIKGYPQLRSKFKQTKVLVGVVEVFICLCGCGFETESHYIVTLAVLELGCRPGWP